MLQHYQDPNSAGYVVDLHEVILHIQAFLYDLQPVTGRQYTHTDILKVLHEVLYIIDQYAGVCQDEEALYVAISDAGIMPALSVPEDFFPHEFKGDSEIDSYYDAVYYKQYNRLASIVYMVYILLNTYGFITNDFEKYEGFIPFTFGDLIQNRYLVFIPYNRITRPYF